MAYKALLCKEEEKAAEKELRNRRRKAHAFDHRSVSAEKEILRFFLAALLTFAVLLLVRGGILKKEEIHAALAENTDLSFSEEVRKGLEKTWKELTLAVEEKRGEN